MPENYRAVANWMPVRFLSWACKFWPYTEDYVGWLMGQQKFPEQAFKPYRYPAALAWIFLWTVWKRYALKQRRRIFLATSISKY